MKHISSALSVLALGAVVVGIFTAQTPGIAMAADVEQSSSILPAHDKNTDPGQPQYINPYDPYQGGLPDHTSAVISSPDDVHKHGYTNGVPDPQPIWIMR
jgi:hypothetical protein